jgi:hypothetical protein
MKTTTHHRKLTRSLILLVFALTSTLAIGLLALPSWADCIYEGQRYPTGTRIGPYVCRPDGTWQPY